MLILLRLEFRIVQHLDPVLLLLQLIDICIQDIVAHDELIDVDAWLNDHLLMSCFGKSLHSLNKQSFVDCS